MLKRLFAWFVHAYTALGLVLAAGMAALIVRGGDDAFRWAFVLMTLATFVDSTDGWLARRARVGEVLPGFDGRRLDDLIDFQTYTSLPLLLVWRAGLLPAGQEAWLLAPLVASAYGFSQVRAKTEDHFFLGFPSYWNVVAFYLYLLRLPGGWALAVLLALAVLTFLPTRYLYPSYGGPWSRSTVALGVGWLAALAAILRLWADAPRLLVLGSLAFPVYYMLVSWAISIRRARDRVH
jgi:phosphatidylcholine synthase